MPPAYEVLLLNTAIPQIQAAQSGDTYVVPRDIAINATAIISANSATDALRITQTGAGNAILVEDSANPDSTPFVVTAAGDVGIGTSSPGYKLHVSGSSGDNLGARFGVTASSQYLEIYRDGGTGFSVYNAAQNAPFRAHIWQLGGTDAMTLNSSGNLGVGTSNPGAKLDVQGATSDQIRVRTAATEFYRFGRNASTGFLDFYGSQTGYQGYTFGGVDGTWATINSSGNLGLGVTPSAWSGLSPSLQMGYGSVYSAAFSVMGMTSVAYYNGGWKYYSTGQAPAQYQMSQGQHQWYTAPSGTAGNAITFTQAMTLDASGNLGVGNTDASAARIVVRTASTTGTAFLADNTSNSGFVVKFASALTSIGNDFNQPLALLTNNTERARITSGGDFLVATATASASDTSNGTVLSSTGGYIISRRVSGSAQTHIQFVNGGTTVGDISTSTTNTTYATSSDYRLKDNQQPLIGSGAFIDALQPKTWNWKSNGSKGVGFIAHEVQAVSPGTVVGEKDAVDADGKPIMQAMEYGSAEFIANIIAELQSLRARVKALEGA